MVLILSSFGYSTNLSAFPSLKPSSIDNKYDIPIGIPFESGTTDLSINTKANLQNTTYGSEILPEELHPVESTLSTLATCEKLPITTVTASGNDGNVPSNVVDNNLGTRWSNLGQGSWIQFDLGSKKSICSVDIAWYRGDIRQNNFVISVSDDGTTFTNKLTGTSNLGTAAEKYTLPGGTEGRYVRITVNGNTENDWASINEISVFGGAIDGGGGGGGGSNVIGTLYHKWQTSAGGSTWSPYSSLSGNIASDTDLAIAMNNDGRLQVFVVGTNNQLYYKTQSAPNSDTWSTAWTSLGGGIKADTSPAVARNNDGRLQVFVVGTNNQLYYKTQSAPNSDTWSTAWTSLGGGLRANTDPIGIANNDGRLQVFVVGTNNQLYYKTQSSPNSSTWSLAWTSLGGGLRDNSNPAVVPNVDGRLDAFVVGPIGPANQRPTADSKSITANINTPADVTLSGSDPDNDPITFSIVDQPTHGSLSSISSQNIVGYTPNAGYSGADSFTYIARDSKGATSINKATIGITVSSTDAGTNDKFGIKKIYSTKPSGEEWYMNMDNPQNDPRTSEPSMSRNSDGSWRVTSGQVRYGVFTSSGYHPDNLVKDHSVLASRGYMQSPNDWKNVEMTGQVKYNSGGDDEWTWYARGGRHTGSGWESGCEGVAYKGSLAYTGGQVRWAKEQWHVSYVFQPWKNSPANGDGKFVGFKVAIYNMELNGKTVVKMEAWVDPSNDNQWQKVYDFVDQGGWGSQGGECRGARDQIVTWGGPIASFRWDDGNSIDIKNLSVREIVPPS
jgi:hypothetical protein